MLLQLIALNLNCELKDYWIMIRKNELILIFLIMFLTIPDLISAQNIELMQQKRYPNYNINTDKCDLVKKQNNVTNKNGNISFSRLSRTVFGFFPSWLNSESIIQNIRFDLLTHIGIFSFDVDSSGNLSKLNSWPWKKLIHLAKQNQVKLILTITSSDSAIIHKILSDKISQNKLFSNITNILIADSLQGVNVDFENLSDHDKSVPINSFLRNFKDSLMNVNRDFELSFASPAVNWGYWDFPGLAQSCDYLFIMCYDYFGSWSSESGPSSPFSGALPYTSHNVKTTISDDYKNVDPQKLILGVPYYGNLWQTKSKDPYSIIDSVSGKWIKSINYNEIAASYFNKEKVWDTISETPFIRWQDASSWYQLWYDDDTSLGLKYDFAVKNNLKGIGIWALGYDNGRQELWNEIESKFLLPSNVNQVQIITPADFTLYQNYPNPFNPSTIIRYKLSIADHVQLKVYDLLGREIMTIVDGFQQAGAYSYPFSSIKTPGNKSKYQLSSGIYFYRLTAGKFYDAKKMILIR